MAAVVVPPVNPPGPLTGTEVTVDVNGTPKRFLVLLSEENTKNARVELIRALEDQASTRDTIRDLYTALKDSQGQGQPQLAYGGRRHKKHGTRKARHGKRKQTRQRK